MTTLFFRTIIFYILIIVALRFTGKRQVGQLELSELVTAFMLSELAAIPISNSNIPLMYGILPMFVLISFEVMLAFFTMKCNLIRKAVDGSPSTLVYKGTIDQKALENSRITMQELLIAVRNAGLTSLQDVDFVFLEPNGLITVIPKRAKQPATPQDLGLAVSDTGIDHALIIDGTISNDTLKVLSKTKDWLYQELYNRKLLLKNVFYLSINNAGEFNIILKEKKK